MIEERKELVLQAIRDYQHAHPRMNPTVRDLCKLTGILSTSLVRFYLKKLAEDGWITYLPKTTRGILLNETRRFALKPVNSKLTRRERETLMGEL